jgi:hypothetical protein
MTSDDAIRLTDHLPVFFDRICCRSWDLDSRKGAGWDLNMNAKMKKIQRIDLVLRHSRIIILERKRRYSASGIEITPAASIDSRS